MKVSPKTIALLSILVYWGPSNALYYAWGFLLLFFILIMQPKWLFPTSLFTKNILLCLVAFTVVFLVSLLVNYSRQNTSLNNAFWTFITYGSSFSALFVFLNLPYRKDDFASIARFSIGLTIFEIALGYFQMIRAVSFQTLNPFRINSGSAAAAGDLFVGTTFDVGIGNEVAVKVSLITLLFIPIWYTKRSLKNSFLLGILAIGWILPSAIYTLLAGIGTIFIHFFYDKIKSAFLTARLSMTVFVSVLIGFFLVAGFAVLQPRNLTYVNVLLTRAYDTALGRDIPNPVGKIRYYKETLTTMLQEYPHAVVTGVGPGNYSSRSAWLVSGAYLETQPGYIPVTPAAAARKFTLTFWRREFITPAFPDASSISYHPFSSWLSVFAEFGLPGLVFFISIFFFIARYLRTLENLNSEETTRAFVFGVRLMLTYLVILMFIDNLFEWPLVMAQFFIFVGALQAFYKKDS